jgi:hypothetical protein
MKVDDSEEDLPIWTNHLLDEEDVQELVSLFVIEEREGSLSSQEIQEFKRHLSLCDACSEDYAVLNGFLGMLQTQCKQSEIATRK